MNEQQHHIWCNFRRGPAEKCKQCIGLKAAYPEIEGDDGEELVQKYFPNVISRKLKTEKVKKVKTL